MVGEFKSEVQHPGQRGALRSAFDKLGICGVYYLRVQTALASWAGRSSDQIGAGATGWLPDVASDTWQALAAGSEQLN